MKNINKINVKMMKIDQEIEEIEELLIKNLKLRIASNDDKYDIVIDDLEKKRKSKIGEILKLYHYKNNVDKLKNI